MAETPPVVGIGHVTCDIVLPLEGWPERDTKTIIPGISLCGGGPTANALAALSRLGVKAGLVGKLGDDLLGRYTYQAHVDDGLDTSHLLLAADAESPLSVILTDLTDSTRTILLTKGRKTTLAPEELDWDWLRGAQVIHLDGHQMPASLAVAREARRWPRTTLVFDAGSMRDGMLELCGLCDTVFASKRFAAQLTGGDDPQQCIAALHGLGARRAGMTAGERGCFFSDGSELLHQPAFSVEVVDTTGAGDAFHGGFVFALVNDMSTVESLRFATAVAAIKCTALGARALPDKQQVEQFLRARP